jgi:multiple sugar transport system permease protein
MPIIPVIGRKTPKLRAVVVLIYTLLILGSVTMVYPFLMMLSGSIKANTDIDTMDPFPKFAYSDKVQFARFEEARYKLLTVESAAYGENLLRYDSARLPNKAELKNAGGYYKFIRANIDKFPSQFYYVQEMYPERRVMPKNFRKFRDSIRLETPEIDQFNKAYRSSLTSWNDFSGGYDAPLVKEFSYDSSDPLVKRYLGFKKSLPYEDKAIVNVDGFYAVTAASFPEVKSGQVKLSTYLSATCPQGQEKVAWEEFVKHFLNCMFVRLTPEGTSTFRSYLSQRFPRGVESMNKINDSHYASFASVNASDDELLNSAMFALYTDFITNVAPVKYLRVDSPQTRYRAAIHNPVALAPTVAYDYMVFKDTKKPFMTEQITRNYLSVIQYVAIYGRAVVNTIIYISLSILAALLVNPLAAYALSRFNLKSTYSILMFFLATMAFPGAVTMIPNFLLLKQLHLLNSFWALILPGVANGYSIFILKGFFDSIPKEVYESAMIDGASEWTMFWKFTMALSTPILALITLNAFTAAYTAVMFALIICPDQKMWTLMVWLYQLQIGAAQPIIYSALVLAAIPTLMVFVLAQNTIMKGIVIPVEK